MLAFKIVLFCISFNSILAEAPSKQISFPGPASFRRLPVSVLVHQNANAPYPAAGFRPDPAFELPTEQQPNFRPDATYGQPDLSYGPPELTYGPPELTYGPPDEVYDRPTDINNVPQSAAITDSSLFFPTTQLSLPYFERQVNFRPRPRRPAAIKQTQSFAPARRPNRVRPMKLLVSVGDRPQQGFAQLPPKNRNRVVVGDRFIGFSERQQNW